VDEGAGGGVGRVGDAGAEAAGREAGGGDDRSGLVGEESICKIRVVGASSTGDSFVEEESDSWHSEGGS